MKNKIPQLMLLLIVPVLFLTACGQEGYKLISGSSNSSAALSLDCGDLCGTTAQSWSKVDLAGSVSGGPYDQTQLLSVNPADKTLRLRFRLPFALSGGEFRIEIPEIPGAFLSISESNTTLRQSTILVEIPLKYIIRGVQVGGEPKKLPNGNALPGIPGGELPELMVKIQRENLTFYVYLGVNAVGVFMPTPGFDPYFNLSFPIRSANERKVLGYLSTVAEKGTSSGGFFVSVVVPDDFARVIDDLL